MELNAPDFVEKVLNGERNFSGITLKDVDVAGSTYTFTDLEEYLKSNDLKEDPIFLEDAIVNEVRAGGIWFPYIRASRTSFKNGYFPFANFENGQFERATFNNTNFQSANCQGCNFYGAYFKNSRLSQTKLKGANFKMTDLTGAVDMQEAIDLGHAHFEYTQVTSVEHKIIMQAISTAGRDDQFDVTKAFKLRR